MSDGASIRFPDLGIEIDQLGRGINIFGFEITYYVIIIVIGMIAGVLLVCLEAKRTGQKPADYFDFVIFGLIAAILGARIYYVAFYWDYYKEHLNEIVKIRNGGLAIYGGIIAAVLCLLIYALIRKRSFLKMADTACLGLILGQVIGRWGNFVNREAFGGFTDGLLAMQIRLDEVSYTTPELLEKMVTVEGVNYIQVQPTFIYESLWNLLLLLMLLIYHKHKRFNGEILLLYLFGYGIGRFWIEGLRTDQLLLAGGLPVSKLLAAVCAGLSLLALIVLWILTYKKKGKAENTR